MNTLWHDLRYGARMLGRIPGFTVIAVITLALGIGANTVIFNFINAALLKPMPVREPERLVAIYPTSKEGELLAISWLDYVDYRDRNDVFSALVSFGGLKISVSDPGGKAQPQLVWGEDVSGNYFSGLGVEMFAGRGFLPEENRTPGAHPVAVVSYNLWQSHFDADRSLVGKTVKLNDLDFTIIGIAPRGFSGARFAGFIPDVWVPAMMKQRLTRDSFDHLNNRGSNHLMLWGRLKPGVTKEQAQAAMNVIARQLEQAYPERVWGNVIKVIPGGVRTNPYMVEEGMLPNISALTLGAAGLVLLIACANIANLLLARATARRREIAVRLSLGAPAWRIVRQLLTESLLLALLGGAMGLLLAYWLADLIVTQMPSLDFRFMDYDYELGADWRVLGFTMLITLLTGILFGLLPALQATRTDLVRTLKGEETNFGAGSRRFSTRNLLVVSQVALSLMLLVGAGLCLKSAVNAYRIDPGFETKNILLASFDTSLQGYDRDRSASLQEQIVERARALPGVVSAALASSLPLNDPGGTDILPEGYELKQGENRPGVGYSFVSPGYFKTMGTPITMGREFDDRDKGDGAPVMIINETIARRYFPNQNPIGKRITLWGRQLEVIGVAKNGKYGTLGEEATVNFLFLTTRQYHSHNVTLILRTAGNPENFAASVMNKARELDPQLPVFGMKTISQFLYGPRSGPQILAGLTVAFALIALLLSAIGIYGALNFSVVQRTREIGIRMALGAKPSDALRLVIAQGISLSLIGIGIGLAGAYFLTRIMGSLLYGVSVTDPIIFAGQSVLLTMVALVACWIPARRATKVDPMIALRRE
ncbi:MAG TPA: ABC transporter permease [Blastocatellia bacterium]|nr:ABC transporter permease [Blastocatellia bacterium]